MNNGKVRIYELSKELNLDNRDILVVCEQLNIAVKSHSSTISEVDAERIRHAAEKYVPPSHYPAHPAVKSGATNPPSASTPAGSKPGESPRPIMGKQQILEIRRIPTTTAKGTDGEPVPPTPPSPPTPPVAPKSVAPSSDSVVSPGSPTPSRPVRPVSPTSTATPTPPTAVAPSAPSPPEVTPPAAPAAVPPSQATAKPTTPPEPTPPLRQPTPPDAVAASKPAASQDAKEVADAKEAKEVVAKQPMPREMPPKEMRPKEAVAKEPPLKLVEPPNRPMPRPTVAPASEATAQVSGQSSGQASGPSSTGQAASKPAAEPVAPILTPPVKPQAVPPSKPAAAAPPLAERPVIKPVKLAQAGGQGDGRSKAPGGAGDKGARPRPAGGAKPGATAEPPLRKPPSVVEIRRPSRPGTGSPAAGGTDAPAISAPPQRLEPRPSRPESSVEKLKPPVRPNAPDAAADGKAGALPGVELVEDIDLRLRRPEPPRIVAKRGKGWEEEEEELLEKPTKAAVKGKRRQQTLIDEDDDEDFESILSRQEGVVQVTLSLVRPAKPKARTPQAKPPVAPAAKVKKPTLGQPGSGSSDSGRGRGRRDRAEEVVKERPSQISLTGSLTVQQLSSMLGVADTEIVKILFYKGILATVTQTLDVPTIEMVAQELEVEVITTEKKAEARKVTEMLDAADLENLQRRPPVVTIMGHVDHGKTTLLDSIRKTKVAQGEAGGITQHIGAYHVDVDQEGKTQQVVFLDTPGHEAFTAMRARGARVTDIAILVVAADDGVQPQTVEAISHAKAAEVPIIVAINKIDKEDAQPDRVKQELTEYGLVAEEWGGQTIMVPVSAIKGENLDTLLEMILLVAEIEELSANPNRPAKGTVIEAHLDKSRGPVATLLIQNGTLRVGDVLVAGSVLGKVRAMIDDRGERVDAASPSFAVEILGLTDVPAAGDEFDVYVDEKQARATADERTIKQRDNRLQAAMASRRVTLNSLSAQAQQGELKELNLILKADVQGSLEAILASLKQLPQNEVHIRVLLAAPGEITETDVDLAAASNAVIIGFNTTFASGARHAADGAGVDVRDYDIIYKLLEDVQGAMEGLLEPELVEESLGQVEVRAVFPVGRGSVAGCYVQSGKVVRNCNMRVRRGGKVIHQGLLDSLRRMKEDAKEVNFGYECGIGCDNFNDWAMGDIIETYRMVTKRRTLSSR